MEIYWIVTEGNDPAICKDGEFGVCVNGVAYLYYKHSEPEPCGSDVKWRKIYKREFGEVIMRADAPWRQDNLIYKAAENYKGEFKESKARYISGNDFNL